ncbi:hypothetical protein [Bartonella sp. AP58NXGY]|uniref:hypothetical protein n=1 Tax=Bartonella sp. AP58NXGY TaxID=3243498 RepID=UPI0035CED8FF
MRREGFHVGGGALNLLRVVLKETSESRRIVSAKAMLKPFGALSSVQRVVLLLAIS